MPNLLLQKPLSDLSFWQAHGSNIFWESPSASYTYQDLFEKAKLALKQSQTDIWEHPLCPADAFVPLMAGPQMDFFAKLWALLELGYSPLLIEAKTNPAIFQHQLTEMGFHLNSQKKPHGEPSIVFKTSGSTAKPKFVFHQLKTLWHSQENLRETISTLKQKPYKRAGLCLPLHHVGGFMLVMRQFFQGETVVALNSYQDLLKNDYQLNALSLVPAQLFEVVESPFLKDIDFILLGGAPLDLALWQKSFEKNLPIFPSYGATESGSLVTLATPAHRLKKRPVEAPNLGVPLHGVALKKDVDNNLMIKSQSLAPGILTSKTCFTVTDEWLTLPDQVAQNENGEWQTLGRKDSVFLCGGENLSPEALEKLYLKHPDILKALISPRPHFKMGQVPHLSFKTASSKNPFQIFREATEQFLKEYPRQYWPRSFDDSLIESSLKILRAPTNQLVRENFEKQKDFPRCFFIHGFLGDQSDFDPLFRELLNLEISSTKLFALSIAPPLELNLNDKEYKEKILERLEKQILSLSEEGPFVLAGYSLGARIVFELMERHNLRPRKVLALAGHPGLKSEQEKQQRLILDQKRASELTLDPEKFLIEWYRQTLFGNLMNHPSFEQRLDQQLKQNHVHNGRLLTCFSLGLQNDFAPRLKEWNASYLYGEQDLAYQQLAKSLSIDTHVIKRASHSFHLENPRDLAEILKTYLQTNQ